FIPQHPTVSPETYPKVGDPNPEVRLGVVSASGGNVKWISLGSSKDIYVPRFGWVNNGVIWAMLLNRAQNQLDLYFIDADSGKSKLVLSEKDDAWIEIDNNSSRQADATATPTFISTGLIRTIRLLRKPDCRTRLQKAILKSLILMELMRTVAPFL